MKKLLAVILMVMMLPCTAFALQVTVNSAGTGTNVTWTGLGKDPVLPARSIRRLARYFALSWVRVWGPVECMSTRPLRRRELTSVPHGL